MSDWAAHADARRRGRRVLAVLAVAAAGVLLLCLGLAPSLLHGLVSGTAGPASAALGCGLVELAGTPTIAGLNAQQVANAATVVAVGRKMNIPPHGWVVALATAAQESHFRNLANPRVPLSMRLPHDGVGRDHDSVGMFQQRPSWGAPAQLLDPRYSSAKFYEKLMRIRGWERMRVTDAAQEVQGSAFPGAYQKWEVLATMLAVKLAGEAFEKAGGLPQCASAGQVSAAGWMVPAKGSVGSGFRTADRPGHDGVDLIAGRGSPIWAAASGTVMTVICNASIGTCDRDGGVHVKGCGWYVEITHGADLWTRYCHMGRRPSVEVGQRVAVGDLLGFVGSSGNSSGPHLHFEVHLANDAIDPVAFMAGRGAPLEGSS